MGGVFSRWGGLDGYFCSGSIIGIAFIKGTDFVLRRFQVRRCSKYLVNGFITTEKRKAFILVAAVID